MSEMFKNMKMVLIPFVSFSLLLISVSFCRDASSFPPAAWHFNSARGEVVDIGSN